MPTTRTCFIVMPLSTPSELAERYGGDEHHFKHVLDELLIPAIKQAGYEPVPPVAEADEVIQARIIEQLQSADLILCDLSTLNPNVMLELGIRTALNHPVRLIRDEFTNKLPFDTSIVNTPLYRSAMKAWELKADVAAIAKHLGSPEELGADNSLWRYFGLTQRGLDARASVTADPEQGLLQLMYEDIQALKRTRVSGSAEDDGAQTRRLAAAAAQLEELADELSLGANVRIVPGNENRPKGDVTVTLATQASDAEANRFRARAGKIARRESVDVFVGLEGDDHWETVP
jgi:hypothetical protein